MLHSLKIFGAGLFLLSLSVSCGNNEDVKPIENIAATILPPSQMRIEQFCQTFEREDFEGLISLMHNYKDQSDKYQSQLVCMMKQRAVERNEAQQNIERITPGDVVVKTAQKIAHLYLDIAYTNGQKEEVLLPLVYDQGNWWIK